MNDQEKTKEELQKELYYLNALKDIDDAKRIQLEKELAIALQEIVFQNEEKAKRAAELIIANLELKFESEEKAKRAQELIIANIELVFQNKEKEKRAAELVIANKELAFQNGEKEKRAAELVIANKELAFQNEEKEKRAEELVIEKENAEESKSELNEKVKELNGLFSIGTLVDKFINIEDICNEFVNTVVPNSMRFPDKVFVELEIGNKKYSNIEDYKLSINDKCLTTPITLFEKLSGSLTVAYLEDISFDEIHEQRLVNAYGERISRITERLYTLEELNKEKLIAQEFENKFRQIAENIDEVFWLRTDSEMIYVSPSFEKIWGVPCETIYKNPQVFTDIIHPEDKLIVEEIVKSNEFNDKGLFQYEYRIIRADNQVRWINAKTVPILDESGNIVKRVGIASDITDKYYSIQELIKAKEHAEESNNNLNEAQHTAKIGNWEYNFITNKQKWSFNCYEIYGLKPNEIEPSFEYFRSRVHPEDLHSVDKTFETIISNHLPSQTEMRILFPDGTFKWFQNSMIPVIQNDKLIALRGTNQDITERKQMEFDLINAKEHAEESDRLKTAFLCNMSHEIRTPMNGILGFADLLKEPKLTGVEQQKYITIIEKSGARMLNIINDIISISKIESGLLELSISETNVNGQLEYEYTFFKPEAEQKGIKLILKNNLPNDTIIKTDKEKLYAILTNLIKNAIKFTDKGSIEFGCDLKNNDLLFYVKDTGVGIHDNRLKAIFERFIQADIEDKRAFQGAGLGLSISKAYVEMLGGKIWVESEADKGSTFYFTIPLINESEKEIVIIIAGIFI